MQNVDGVVCWISTEASGIDLHNEEAAESDASKDI